MFPLPNPALCSNVSLLLDFYVEVSLRIFDTMQKVSALNLQLGRDLIAEAGADMQRVMNSKDAAQLGSAIAAQWQPGRQSLQSYQHRVAEQLAHLQPGSLLRH
ncbi:hypothetical protein GTP45_15165 [Pseudoduganella sp. FT55W]|uniref:Phasin domain-containing protein n=1 Tax=Duganella rivi TaxID=2666083 RepID=A0A7X4GR54_9BURK|nr:phasin family protein [Duganella rivi]MYM68160.1 hypothetical protein [Duganella rivi]